jgi:hypothetical protein
MLATEQAWKEGGVRIWIAGLVGALQMLAATPEFILFTWFLLCGIWLINDRSWKTFGRLGAVVAIVTGLVAAQLLPFFDLLSQSRRNVLFDPGLWAMPRWGWANFFVPLFHTRPVPQGVYFPAEQPLFTSYYVTVPMLALGLHALVWVRDRKVLFLAGVTALGLWLAMGKHGYLYTWLLKLCPLLGFMRYPAKFLVLTAFALPLLGAFGLAHWRHQSSSAGAKMQVRVLTAMCGVLFLLIAGVVLYAHRYPLPEHDGAAVWWNGLWRGVFLIVAFLALLGLRRTHMDAPRWKLCSVGLLLSLLTDSLTQVPKHYPTAPSHVYAPGAIATRLNPPPSRERARAMMGHVTHDFLFYNMLSDPFADLIGRRVSLFGNLNLLDGVAVPDGFYAMYLPAQRDIWTAVYTSSSKAFPEGLADFLALSHITSHTNAMEWVVRSNAMSLISAGQAPRFEDGRPAFGHLLESSFDPRKVVYLPREAGTSITVTGQTDARVIAERVRSHEVDVEVEAAQPSLVVVSQSHYRSWQAFIDGKSTRIWPANHAFQAVQVPAGRHKLQFIYRDRSFRRGVGISGLTLGLVLFVLFRFRHALRQMWMAVSEVSP